MATDDAGDDFGDVGLWIDIVELGGLDERGDDGPVFGAAVGAGEQAVLAGQRQGPDGALDGVVVDLDAAITEEDSGPPSGTARITELFPTRSKSGLSTSSLSIKPSLDWRWLTSTRRRFITRSGSRRDFQPLRLDTPPISNLTDR